MAHKVHKGDVNGIPVISLAPFIDGSNKPAVADAMLDSFKTIGFVYLVDHGLPKDKIAGMFEWVRVRFPAGSHTGCDDVSSSLRDFLLCQWRARCWHRTLRPAPTTEVREEKYRTWG